MLALKRDLSRSTFSDFGRIYFERCFGAVDLLSMSKLQTLAEDLIKCWEAGGQLFVFGNGGSAANAMHIANDFMYLATRALGYPARVTALGSNNAILSCLANDEGYQKIFELELAVHSRPGDIALALSGSGKSKNVVSALRYCGSNNVKSYALLGFGGGEAQHFTDVPIILPIDDMQICEDLQLMVGHLLTRWIMHRAAQR